MAYVTIPKDLSRIKPKFLFGLTKRQFFCFGGGALVGVPVFFLVKPLLGTSASMLCMIVLMLPFFMLALYEKNGQPLEVLLRQYIQARYVRPRVRPYKTENIYDLIERSAKARKEVQQIVQKKR